MHVYVYTEKIYDEAAVGAATRRLAKEGLAVRRLRHRDRRRVPVDAQVARVGHRVPEAKDRIVTLRVGEFGVGTK